MTEWREHQEWERQWWGNCVNTYAEETKQLTYAHRMGLTLTAPPERPESWPVYDMAGKSVIDLGGGPVSMLLKAVNVDSPTVVDPCPYPAWVSARYLTAGIDVIESTAEGYHTHDHFDECWIYNVLQHVIDPEAIVAQARELSDTVRLFEWVDLAPSMGHPHTLTVDGLNRWLGGVSGVVEQMHENGCYGKAYYYHDGN